MPPLKIEAWYARPMLAPVRGPPGGRLKSGGVEYVRIPRIYRDVLNVAIAFKHLPPGFAGILRQVDAGKTLRQVLERDRHIYDVTIDPRDANILYAAGFES